MNGKLYLVATPLGNLGDITFRAVETLRMVDFVVCEDTRHSRRLFDHYGISTRTFSLPAFVEGERAAKIIERLHSGENAAFVSDAGSPAVSDPGEKLVREALENNIEVIPIPGPSAVIAGIGVCGLPSGRFHFLGFLPRKGPERKAMLEEVAALSSTLVVYEAPSRLTDTLAVIRDVLGNRQACVAREMTKIHEEFRRSTLEELRRHFQDVPPLGEIVLYVEGRCGDSRWTLEEVTTALGDGLAAGEKLKGLSTEIAGKSGWTGQEVYRLGLSMKGNN